MNGFDRAFRHVLKHEGRLTNDLRDPGGITKFGISIKFAGSVHLDIDGDGDTDAADIIALTLDDAEDIYREHFWKKARCDELPPALALMAFDMAVNQGVGAAMVDLQRAAGVDDDGVFGPVTRRAVHRGYGVELLEEYASRRAWRYGQTRNFARYGLGWSRRAADTFVAALTAYNNEA